MSARVLEVDVTFDLRGATGAGGRRRLAFDAPAGVTAVVGPSGVGKSTALDVLAGLAPARAGTVRLGGRVLVDVARGVSLPPDARRLGVVLQGLWLFPDRTARANVAFGASGTAAERREAADRWLRRVHAGHVAERRPGQLSGGEAQRVALARALARGPEALLLDEPFTALHPELRATLGDETRALALELGVPVVLVTHDEGEAARLAGDRVVRLGADA